MNSVNEEEKPPVDFDSVLDEIGSFGKFQKILYYSVCVPIILTTCIGLSIVFSVAVPKSRCVIPSCDKDTNPQYSDAFNVGFANFSIPWKNESGEYATCEQYKFLNNQSLPDQCVAIDFNPNLEQNCSMGQIYDDQYYGSTVISEFDLACGEEWKIPFVESSSFVGIMIAAMSFGLLADKYGRKHVLMICLSITIFAGIMESLSVNFWMYLFFQTLGSLGQAGCFQTGFILALETVGKSHRVFCGTVIEFFFVGGEVLLTLIAMTFRSWKWLTAFPSIFLSLVLFSWPFVPESVRWLLSKGRNREAEELMLRMANTNKVPDINLEIHRTSRSNSGENEGELPSETLVDIIKSRTMALRFLNSCFCWMVVTMVYYGLSLNATNLAGNPYTNFILVSLVEIPGYSLSYFTMEKIGRKKSTALSLLIGGGCCLISSAFVGHQNSAAKTIMTITFLLGKLGVTWTFGNIYIYTSELFPTSTRTACVGACSTAGRIGAIVSPYIAGLSLSSHPWLPMMIFGVMAFISGALVFLHLPETLGYSLPETISEAVEQFQNSENLQNQNSEPESPENFDENSPLLASA